MAALHYRHRRHGRDDDRRHAGLETDGSARERKKSWSSAASRSRTRSACSSGSSPTPTRRPSTCSSNRSSCGRSQGPDHQRRLRAAHAGAAAGRRTARGPAGARAVNQRRRHRARRANRRTRPVSRRRPGRHAGRRPAGGIIGVTSKSTDTSIRLYKGRSHYNEWAFVYTAPVQAPGAAAPGSGAATRQPQPPGGGIPGRGGRGPFPGGPTGPVAAISRPVSRPSLLAERGRGPGADTSLSLTPALRRRDAGFGYWVAL